MINPMRFEMFEVDIENGFLALLRGRRAQAVKGMEEHLRSFHHEKPAIGREAAEFGRRLTRQDVRFLRDHTVVELPVNGLAPQPVVRVVDSFSCHLCAFLTVSRCLVRKHVNNEHSREREEDERIFAQVRIQSWYGPKRERYWVVRDAVDGLGKAKNGRDEPTSEVDEIEQGIRRWQDEATERRLRLQTEPLAYELDARLNFTKWHAVLSRSKHDMLWTYEFLVEY